MFVVSIRQREPDVNVRQRAPPAGCEPLRHAVTLLRDALRFLHGIGRGHSLADIFGEKRGETARRVRRPYTTGVDL